MAGDTLFRATAPGIMRRLMTDFRLGVDDAAAILGNLGHESSGFKQLQEGKPLIKGSRGGYGYAQWTGDRRRKYEAYCDQHSLDPASKEANYGYLCVELRGDESAAIPAVRAATTLRKKVEAFERKFERAAKKYKHYDMRERWAKIALSCYRAATPDEAVPLPRSRPLGIASTADEEADEPDVAEADVAPDDEFDAARQKVQEQLIKLGYFEVGAATGKGGSRTDAAIQAFRNDNGLAVSAEIDDDLKVALMSAPHRPVAPERERMTADDLRAKGSTTLTLTDRIKLAAGMLFGGGAVAGGAEGGGTVDTLTNGATKLSGLKSALNAVGVSGTTIIVLVVSGLAFWFFAHRIEQNRVNEARIGKNP